MNKEEIENLALEMGYMKQIDNPQNKLLRFKRDDLRVDVWYSRMTVGIMEKNKEARFLYNVPDDDLIEILANPEKIK